MALINGSNIGPYQILSPLGAGGMGEVYRARDTRLDREVAIKVLPAHLTRSVEFKQRFEREARSISQLSHPHICTLHDVGHHDGTDYLVMELLEGETLDQRLTKGALPLDQVLLFGEQIASALDAAHRKGVVHRDLKPGNIMLTKTGAKLLDFGLAKSAAILESDPSAITVTQPLTSKGTIIGTFQYMAPEQLEGEEADTRTDIFSFGAVLYEMLTGKRAFEGQSRASLIASIMASQPRPLTELQPMTPPALDRVIRKCLGKERDARWQSAADLADELRWIGEGGSQVGETQAWAVPRQSWLRRSGPVLAVMAVALLGMILFGRSFQASSAVSLRATILPPEGATLLSTSIFAGPVAVSPDGTNVCFSARKGEEPTLLWVRPLDSFVTTPLAGTEGATRPFWSPDSRHIGFFADGKLKRIPATGGPVFALADTTDSRGGTWNKDDLIVYAPQYMGPLYAVSASGGQPKQVTELNQERGENTHRYPHFLPDGRHFLYLARGASAGAGREPAIVVGSLDSSERHIVLRDATNVAYASGHLLFEREGTLMVQPFDLKSLQTKGPVVPLVSDLRVDERFSLAVFSASQNGVLAFQTGKEQLLAQLVWLDREGRQLGTVGEPQKYYLIGVSLSPGGSRVAIDILDRSGRSDVWLHDFNRDVTNKLTISPADDYGPIWTPNGQRVIYASGQGETYVLSEKSIAASGTTRELWKHRGFGLWPTSISPNGEFLVFTYQQDLQQVDLWVLPLSGDREPWPVVENQWYQDSGQFSPDGRWIAYLSNESGRDEVYALSFPDLSQKIQISTRGGAEPRWRRDGKELFYFAPDNMLMAAQISSTDGSLEVGKIEPLFRSREMWLRGFRYDVAPDGERFLFFVPLEESPPASISIISNWTAELKNK
jgi:eukaryotic-like serine/threonine-protein kinase